MKIKFVLRYHLRGAKQGVREIFADLPGHSDNIRLTPNRDSYLVPMPLARTSTGLLDLFGRYPLVRTFFGYVSFFVKQVCLFKASNKSEHQNYLIF